jgi:hypothetical protein
MSQRRVSALRPHSDGLPHRFAEAAAAIVEAELRHYAASGAIDCELDFEASNPEATAFWTRYVIPVCYSLMRVPGSA